MQSVTVFCLSVALLLWADVAICSPVNPDSPQVDRLFYAMYLDAPGSEKVLALAKPCVEEGFTKLEPAALESVTKYVDAYRECQSKVGTEGTETEQEAKVQLCLKDGPARSEEHGKAVEKVFEVCVKNAVEELKKTSPEFDSEESVKRQ